MSKNSLYKALVIGLGRVGLTLEGEPGRADPCTHAGCFKKHPKTNLMAGFDPSSSRCQSFETRYPQTLSSCENFIDFFRSVRPEIVSISTCSDQHLPVLRSIEKALDGKHWLKGILLEKPVGMNLEEGYECLDIESRLGLSIVVCHDRRFYPYFRSLKPMMTKRGLGKFRHMRGAVYCGSFLENKGHKKSLRYFGGPLLHDGTHLIDLMIYYAGAVTHASGISLSYGKKNQTEDTTLGTLFFGNNITGSFLAGGRRKYFHFEFEMEWERAKLLYSHGKIQFLKKPSDSPYLRSAKLPESESQNPYINRLDHLIDIIENKAQNESSLLDGLQALEAIHTIYESSRNQGRLVSVGKSRIPKLVMV
jgi:predicted dehydrogenase